MLADMSIGVEAARLCYQKAAWQADMVRNARQIVSSTRLHISSIESEPWYLLEKYTRLQLQMLNKRIRLIP